MTQPDTKPEPVKLLSDHEVTKIEARTKTGHYPDLDTIATLCATVRTLRDENSTLRKHWADTSEDLASAWLRNDELKDQLAQITQARDRLQERLTEEVAKRVNNNAELMEQSQKVTQVELERHCSDDRLSDTQRGSYQD